MTILRIDYGLAQKEGIYEESASNKCLNVELEMVDEGKQYRDVDSDESLSYVYYKIKNRDEQNFIKVKSQTEDPNINFGEDLWNNAPGIFYIPGKDREEFKEGLQRLREHFSEFSVRYLDMGIVSRVN
ncbi:MAG: hypothetical protein ACOC4M_17000 [Promethearchaeia archaeon]